MIEGIEFRSNVLSSALGTLRAPLISVSVRVVPRPRRSRLRAAMLPLTRKLLVDGVVIGRKDGIWLSASPTLVMLRFCTRSWPTTLTGVGELKLERARRDPVTTISRSGVPSASEAAIEAAAGA